MIDPNDHVERRTLEGNERLEVCAAKARETDRQAKEAEADVSRLRKEMKRARKAYKEAKDSAKDAAKAAQKARHELSQCLDGAFRDLAMNVRLDGTVSTEHDEPPSKVLPSSSTEAKPVQIDPEAASG